MDASLLIGLGVVALGSIALAWGIPAGLRDTRRRQARGASGLSGIAAGWDAVWAPTAHEAEKERIAKTEATAPAPAPGDPGGDLDGGPIVIELGRRDER